MLDLLGILAPVTIRAKLFIARPTVWKEGIDWDEPLTTDLRTRWLTIACDTSNVSIPRYFLKPGDS